MSLPGWLGGITLVMPRIWGYEKLPITLPSRRGVSGRLEPAQRLRRRAEDALLGAGVSEILGWSFAAPSLVERLGIPADETVMLGDTPYDIDAAKKAGVAVIAFRCGGWDDAGLAGAMAIYDSPADLLRHYDRSPLGRAKE